MRAQRDQSLDAIRGAAAFLVLLLHVGLSTKLPLAPGGYLAVDAFFLMSGFLIATTYDGRITSRSQSAAFLFGRVARLYPVYLFGVVLSAAVMILGNALGRGDQWPISDVIAAAARSAAFTPSLDARGGPLFPLNTPYWSIIYELLAYLAFALTWRVRFGGTRFLVVIAGIVLIAQSLHGGGLDAGSNLTGAPAALARLSFSFGAGLILARSGVRLPARWIAPLAALSVICMMVDGSPSFRGVRDLVCVMVFFPLALVAIARRSAPLPLQRLGVHSYALYATHAPTILTVRGGLKLLAIEMPPALIASLCCICAVSVAWAVTELIDRPARRHISGWLIAQSTRPALSAGT